MAEPQEVPAPPGAAPHGGQAAPPADPSPRQEEDRRRAAWIFGGLLLVVLVGIVVFAPAELPLFKQRLLAFLSATVAGLIGHSITGTLVVDSSFQSPLVKVKSQAAGGFAMFVLVLLWWLMPAVAPVAVSPSVHRVDVQVLDPRGRPVEEAKLTSSPSGEITKTASGWEIVLPAERLGEDRRVTLRAAKPEAFLIGKTTVTLAERGSTRATLTLEPEPEVSIRGRVVDPEGRAVPGVRVAVDGHSTTTDEIGEFEVETGAAEGQSVRLSVEKEGFRPVDQYHPAGASVTLHLRPGEE